MSQRERVGLSAFTVFGNAFSCAVQYGLVYIVQGAPYTLVPYVLVWFLGQVFGFSSTLAQGILISSTAPKESRGFWTGMSNASGNAFKFAGPLVLAVLYEATSETTVLLVCGSISLVATIAYLPLGQLVPKPLTKDLQPGPMEEYEKMAPSEYRRLPLMLRQRISNARKAEGKEPFMHGWGTYDEQRPHLEELMTNSVDDFAYLKSNLIELLTDRPKLANLKKTMQTVKERNRNDSKQMKIVDSEKQKLGAWMGDYFDDAGYESWYAYPELYKAMVMNAFPPVDKIDSRASFDEGTLAEYEEKMLRFLAVMDDHLSLRTSRSTGRSEAFAKLASGIDRPHV